MQYKLACLSKIENNMNQPQVLCAALLKDDILFKDLCELKAKANGQAKELMETKNITVTFFLFS